MPNTAGRPRGLEWSSLRILQSGSKGGHVKSSVQGGPDGRGLSGWGRRVRDQGALSSATGTAHTRPLFIFVHCFGNSSQQSCKMCRYPYLTHYKIREVKGSPQSHTAVKMEIQEPSRALFTLVSRVRIDMRERVRIEERRQKQWGPHCSRIQAMGPTTSLSGFCPYEALSLNQDLFWGLIVLQTDGTSLHPSSIGSSFGSCTNEEASGVVWSTHTHAHAHTHTHTLLHECSSQTCISSNGPASSPR